MSLFKTFESIARLSGRNDRVPEIDRWHLLARCPACRFHSARGRINSQLL